MAMDCSFPLTYGSLSVRLNQIMKITGRDKIVKYGRKHSRARKPLATWLKITEVAKWEKSADIKATFGYVDNPKDNEYVFNIGGYNYRLIALVVIKNGIVIIKTIMTHSEYTKKYKP